MLSTIIKEATKFPHQELEKKIIPIIKAIQNEASYADFLKHFYAYFTAVEKVIAPFINKNVLPDVATRRNASFIKNDIEALGCSIDELPMAVAPEVNSLFEAVGALYVLEGSIMGGPYIVQMLQKNGIKNGLSFFSGYGAESGKKWTVFTNTLNFIAKSDEDKNQVIKAAHQTFERFGHVFGDVSITNS